MFTMKDATQVSVTKHGTKYTAEHRPATADLPERVDLWRNVEWFGQRAWRPREGFGVIRQSVRYVAEPPPEIYEELESLLTKAGV